MQDEHLYENIETRLGNNVIDDQLNGNERPNSPLRRNYSQPESRRNEVMATLVKRTQSMKETMKKGTAEFFGLTDEDKEKQLWTLRQKRLLARKFGKLKDENVSDEGAQQATQGSDVSDGLFQSAANYVSSAFSTDREYESGEGKEPVLKMTWDGLAYLYGTVRKKLFSQTSEYPVREVFAGGTLQSDGLPHTQITSPPIQMMRTNVVLSAANRFTVPDEQLESFIPPQYYYNPPSTASPNQWQRLRKGSNYRMSKKRIKSISVDHKQNGIFAKFLDKVKTIIKPKIVDDYDDYRPYFTYYVTATQTIILILSLIIYGFGPFGFARTQKTALVFVASVSLQQVDYYEPDNFWLGPRASDLIRLGAKFTPCMRKDKLIYDEIYREREVENGTGCCVRVDHSGCVQTLKFQCSDILSVWEKWDSKDIRKAGPVCGQDPKYCLEPASVKPYEWSDDLTKWPICRKNSKNAYEKHMTCDVVARPCCFGINGECKIMTKEHCDFVKGFYHEEAALCSQVSCMSDICGMAGFFRNDSPDQFYRLFLSLFIHAGILHLLTTIILQMYFMRDLEKMIGSFRMSLLYILSGIAGNMASAIFIPYRAEVGPSGSQFGLLACFIVQVLNYFKVIEKPCYALIKLLLVAFALFVLGIFPWIDNYAHIIGFVTGIFLSLMLVPSIQIKPNSSRIATFAISSICTFVIFLLLFLFLFIYPIYSLPSFFTYFNCFPFTQHWCADQDIKIVRVDKL